MSDCKTPGANISSVERDPVFISQKGKPGGAATLDASGKVPLAQLPLSAISEERDPVYIADRGKPFGVPTLDGSSLVPREQLGEGVADGTKTLFGDGTWRVPPSGNDHSVPTSRKVNTTAPLEGGGSLTTDLSLTVDAATTSTTGVVQLAPDGGVAAGTAVQGNDSRLTSDFPRLWNVWWFGDGGDGDLSLSVDTTLSLHQFTRRFHNLSLNGHTLTNNSADKVAIIYVSGTLDLGSGGKIINGTTPVGGGAGGHIAPGPDGGSGGGSIGSLYVFARKIIGTGTISAAGHTGAAGISPSGSGNSGGAAGTNASNTFAILGNAPGSYTVTGAIGGDGGIEGDFNGFIAVGGAGGVGYTDSSSADIHNTFVDYQNLLLSVPSAVLSTGSNSLRYFASIPGAGGGCGGLGGSNQSTMSGGGGAGGGGAAGFVFVGQNGGNGGNGGSTKNTGGAGGGGSGGGGGGSGSVVVVVSNNAPATLTVTANGGAGGAGANAFGNGGGGGGGGGGAAGVALYVGPAGPTVTATGGAGGLGGNGGSPDFRVGSSGSVGADGLAMAVTF